MNCPSRTDEPPKSEGWNQSPPEFSGDLTTRQDFNGLVNLREQENLHIEDCATGCDREDVAAEEGHAKHRPPRFSPPRNPRSGSPSPTQHDRIASLKSQPTPSDASAGPQGPISPKAIISVLIKYSKFVGPGFMVSVAYIDPGNYSTDVAAGAAKRFRLLFIVLMSNVFAILLQSLAVRLGTVTGLNLAEHCRAHLPRWLNFVLYFLGEAAIIATDIAEVGCYSLGICVVNADDLRRSLAQQLLSIS